MKGAEEMKYILMMSAPKAGFDTYRAWSKQDMQAHLAVLNGINKELTEGGEFVATEGLDWPDQATLVRAGKGRAPITDGVCTASKGILGAYWIFDAESPGRAAATAARASAALSPGRA